MKIGIFGGTFNPPHKGHIEAAAEAIAELGIDRMLLVPDRYPPHKEMPDGSPTCGDRLEMLRLASADMEKTEICDVEIKRSGRSYTIETIREIKKIYPGDKLYLMVGTDMFTTLESWREGSEILKSIPIVVFGRTKDDFEEIENCSDNFREKYNSEIHILKNNIVEISSRELREQLKNRKGTVYLDERVYEYIIENKLYGARPEFDWLRRKAHNMLEPRRSLHVIGCEEEAVKLAERWGADPEEARTAAILHDITKNLSTGDQLLLCEKYGIITDNIERREGKLLHAKTGAAIAKDRFGVSDQVYSAIYWHTTGKADMSLLDKIMYIADYIEPHRNFSGLHLLRRLAYTDLDAALLKGLEMSMEDLVSRGVKPHAKTAEAIEWLRQNG